MLDDDLISFLLLVSYTVLMLNASKAHGNPAPVSPKLALQHQTSA